jgi:ATP-dependent Lhr-like helicase
VNPALEGFHPCVQRWFERRFDAPSRAQELGWPAIREAVIGRDGFDVLLCAPTGSGKTLAAFMWAIDALVGDVERGELTDEVSVLYVSPLKALANDVRINLEEPLAGVAAAGAESGLDLAKIRAGLRTGDTPVAERNAMARRPPQILVTTPESLFILITSPRFREKLARVRCVIVDELHAIAGNKRGAHLAITLERLERMVTAGGRPRPRRIGLSATLNPIETLAAFLAGFRPSADAGTAEQRPARIVRADSQARTIDLQVVAPGPELGPLATHQHWEAMYEEIARLIGEHRTTLVFTLSRRWAERIALALQKRVGAEFVMAHHGSLARAERLAAEQKLKRGELKAIVATASLELGIDVGAVDLVCQVDSPKSISAAVQRIGRSGHSLGATPRGRFFALTLDDLIECAAAVRAIRRGHLDAVEIPEKPLDVAAQQIIAIAAEEGDIAVTDILQILRSAYNFRDFSADELSSLLRDMAHELPNRIMGAAPKIFFDAINARVRPRRSARLSAITSGGTIPEAGNYDVVIESEGRKIGDVEEDFAQESARGDVFSLGSMPWQIQRVSRGRLMVEPAPGMAPSLPFWQTEAGGRSPALSTEITELRHEIASRLTHEDSAAAFLQSECALDERAAIQAVDYVRRGYAALGAIPDDRTVVVERFFDGLGGTQIVIHTPFGIRLNRGLGLAIRKKLCQSFDFEIQASAIDDGVLLALNARHSFALDELFTMVRSHNLRATLVQALLAAPMFEVRFRHVASRALAVMRSSRGRRVPAWIQRLRSNEILAALFPQQQACFENRPPAIEIPRHFIVDETLTECLTESTDAARAEKLLAGIERGEIRVVGVDSVAPSVFAQRLLLAWDYSFLDDGERANRRSRTVTMNRAMAEDVFRSEDLSQMLATDAVAAVTAEVSGLAPGQCPRNADELLESIKSHGSLPIAEIERRAGANASSMLSELRDAHRVAMFEDASAGAVVIAAEDAPLFGAAYGGVASEQCESARLELVRRAMRTAAIIEPSALARRLAFPLDVIAGCLAALEASGAVFRGHFTSPDIVQYCDRYNLERIHRMTLARVRAEVEPCTDEEFIRMRIAWMHIGGAGLGSGASGVGEAVGQLAGVAFEAGAWEREILPARIPGYRPEYLDQACSGGEYAWIGSAGDAPDARAPTHVMFARREDLPLFCAAQPEHDDPACAAVAQALGRTGAFYLDELADRANLSERDTLAALWRLAAAGRATNDSFAPIRMLTSDGAAVREIESGPREARRDRISPRRGAAIRARLKSRFAGRWSAIAHPAPTIDPSQISDRAREIALILLERHGIVAREVMALETLDIAWGEIAFALRRLELSGQVRRGWFVRSLSAEQYAMAEAVDLLRAARVARTEPDTVVAMSAIDPANPFGALVAGCGIARERGNLVAVSGGRMIAGLHARAVVAAEGVGEREFAEAINSMLAIRSRLTIESIDGTPALASAHVASLAGMGFHSDGRALVYDGLHGPAPAGARRALIERPNAVI